jgi:hypothetical protein
MTVVADNAPRWRTGTDHVESWFVRANHPSEPRAVWLKATVLCRADGTTIPETWCSVFDGTRTAAFRGAGDIDGSAIALRGDGGASRGQLDGDAGRVEWDVSFTRASGPWAEPMCLLPSRRLVDGPFPKSKLLTPFPVLDVGGEVAWDGDRWDLTGWVGMQGHNWGTAHSPEYAWAQCVFPEQEAVVEAASGRIELGRRSSPLFSMLVVRRGSTELRFDRIVDRWRQKPHLAFPAYELSIRGRDGSAHLSMTADPEAMVCLGYDNPARPRSYCLNSKTAEVRLQVRPKHGAPFELASPHGGALEFLQPTPELRVQPVV